MIFMNFANFVVNVFISEALHIVKIIFDHKIRQVYNAKCNAEGKQNLNCALTNFKSACIFNPVSVFVAKEEIFLRKLTGRELTFTALFIALITVGTFVRIPVGSDVYTLQFLFTLLAGLILGARLGTQAVGIYVLMGRRSGIYSSADLRVFDRIYFSGVFLRKIFAYVKKSVLPFNFDGKYRRHGCRLSVRNKLVLCFVQLHNRRTDCIFRSAFLLRSFANCAGFAFVYDCGNNFSALFEGGTLA